MNTPIVGICGVGQPIRSALSEVFTGYRGGGACWDAQVQVH